MRRRGKDAYVLSEGRKRSEKSERLVCYGTVCSVHTLIRAHSQSSLFCSEFIEVDKKESALECLNDVIHSKKHRQSWTTTHEHIMRLFVELCVDLQRSAFAKDGLYQYRNICRDVSLQSFEVVSTTIIVMCI